MTNDSMKEKNEKMNNKIKEKYFMVMIVVKSELAVTLTSLSQNLQNLLDFFKLLVKLF